MENNNKTLGKFHGPSKNRLKIFSVVFVVTVRVFKKVKTYITNKMKNNLQQLPLHFVLSVIMSLVIHLTFIFLLIKFKDS